MEDYVVKAYAYDGTVRMYAASTTRLVEDARRIHDLWPTSAAALGRTLTAVAIMGTTYPAGDELTIRFESDGDLGGMIVTTKCDGYVRGTLGNPHVLMQKPDGKLDVGGAVGKGFLHVTKDLKVRDIFTSTSEIVTGEIGDDFAYYFAQSEQIPSVVALGVKVGEDNAVMHAGGIILQAMPGCKEETIATIEARASAMANVTTLLEDGKTPEDLIAVLADENARILERKPLGYRCDCSKETFERGLIALGNEELRSLLEEQGTIETTCHFCQAIWRFTEVDVRRLMKQSKEKGSAS